MKLLTPEESHALTTRLCQAFMDGYEGRPWSFAKLAAANPDEADCYRMGQERARVEAAA